MARRRTAAGLAALIALSGTLVFAGAIAANADSVIEFTSPADGAVIAATTSPITFTGTTTNTDYTQTIDVWNYSSGSPDSLCTGMDPSSGIWSCESSLSPGFKDIRVFQGPNSDTLLFELRLPTLNVTGPAVVAAASTVDLTGNGGYFGALVYAEVTNPALPALNCTDAVVTDGSWTCDIPFDAELTPDTDVTVTVTQSYGAAISQPVTHTFHVAAAPPAAVTIDSPTDGFAYTWDAGIFASISGRAPLGNPVDVLVDAAPVCTGLAVDAYGQWDCGSLHLDPGAHTIVAQQLLDTDTANVDVEVPAPDILGLPLFAQQGDDEYTINGNYGFDGYLVHLQIDGDEVCRSWVFEGTWSCYYLDVSDLTLGDHTVTVWQAPFDPDIIVTSQTANHTLTIQVPDSAPTLNCSFSPGGGFSATSPQQLEALSIYQLFEAEISMGGSVLAHQGYCNGSPGATFPEGTEFLNSSVAACDGDCDPASITVGSLAPGDYEVYHRISDGYQSPGVSYESHSYVFTIPEAPTIGNAASTTNSVILSGGATPGDAIRVVRSNGTNLCTTTTTGAGTWVCAFPKSSASTARAIAVDAPSGGMSAYSSSRNIPIFVAAPTAEPTLPTLPTLVTWFLEFGGDLSNLKPGDTFTLNVSGMPEGTEIEVWMHSTPQLIGTATGTGAPMQLQLTVPDDIESGPHEIEMVAVTPLGTNYFFTSDAMVIGGVEPAEVPEDESATEEAGTSGGGSGPGDRSDPAAPSALTDSIAPVAQILDNPITIAVAGGLALALLFLVALPTELLNSSLSSNSSRLGRVYGTVDRALTRAQDWLIRFTRSRAIAAGLLVVIVAIIYGFVDPNFGFDVVSLRLVLSLGIAFFILSFVASWISGIIIRRAWGAIGVVAMQPTIILFAVVGVIVARILEFSPGFLVGVAIGLELLQASKHVTARAVFVQIGVVTGLALAAWIVYSLFTPGDDFIGMLVDDTMVAVTAEGLTGALIAVFPLKFLDGRELWEVSKRLWAAAFLLVAAAFALLVLPTAIEGTDVADYGVWLIVFAVFGLISLAVWLVFVRADKRAAEAERAKVDA